MAVKIRRAREDDLFIITTIYNSVIAEGKYTADMEPYDPEDRRKWFDDHNGDKHGIYIVEISGNVVGYFYFSPWRPGRSALAGVAELSFFIDQNARGKGLGDTILKKAIDLAKDKDITHLLAILLDINIRSQKLLEKYGFEIAGEFPGIVRLRDQVCGQLIMLKKIHT